ncbi:MAG TPA: sugar ABC transporter permease [Ilumatobacteraceae bacterium]|nr:sugar ABC transporter permease [Ilumatobacteraceae bacterium]
MTDTQTAPATTSPTSSWRSGLASAEIDSRMVGMIAAIAVIWIGFNILSGGDFLTARNLWNLSVQSTSIAIMATGMVLIIVSRNIDLSVGSLLGFLGYVMAMVQTRWIPNTFDLGLERWYTWLVALAVGVTLGALVGLFQGFLVGYIRIPAFIVTLGGFLIWRGLIFRFEQGQTLAPLDSTFSLLGGGPNGSLGDWKSWLLGALACALIIVSVLMARRRRQRYDLPLRPTWIDGGIAVLGCAVVLGAVWVANAYFWPEQLARQYAEDNNIDWPEAGLKISTGIAYPVVILIVVTMLMTFLARRRRFGRYVYAIGGNPEAAELGGINTRKIIMLTFVLMGVLCAVSAAVQTARLNAAVTNLGVTNELDVISAAVIGGTSFAGGVGTIPGAVLGAVIMQSLRSGMVLLKVDSPMQDVVVGLVLIIAVGLDSTLRKGKI